MSIIDSYQYQAFHYVLSIRRIYKETRNKKVRRLLLTILKLLLLDTNELEIKVNQLKLEQLKYVFKIIRKVAIVSLDSYNSHTPVNIDITALLLSFDYFENKYQGLSVNKVLDPILSILYDEVYLKGNVQTRQRFYEVAAIEDVKANALDYEAVIQKALINGLFDPNLCQLKHFARYTLPIDVTAKSNLSAELRNIQTVKRQCPHVEASLDLNPVTGIKVVDFYFDKSHFSNSLLPRFVFNIASILQDQIAETVKNQNNVLQIISKLEEMSSKYPNTDDFKKMKEKLEEGIYESTFTELAQYIIPAFRNLLWWVLKHFIADNYIFDIDIQIKNRDFFSFKLIKPEIDLISSRINQAIKNENDGDRIHELSQLKSSAERKFEGFVFVCLSRIQIYDKTQPPEHKKVTDIDSIVIKSKPDQFLLEFHESKNTKRQQIGQAKKDLKEKLVKVLNQNAKGYRIKPVAGKGAKLVISISSKKT